MQAAEQLLIDKGISVEVLMKLAGEGAAQQIWRLSGNMPTLVLCGPGNNGGDGYIVAKWLLEKGVDVSVANIGEPQTDAAKNAKSFWQSETVSIDAAKARYQLVDCLFGTGLRRALDRDLVERLSSLHKTARRTVAIDLPSGIESDTGHVLSNIGRFDYTIALGAFKPSHFLEQARANIGKLLGVDIGVSASSNTAVLSKPKLFAPASEDHKYSRGLVAVVGGAMPGASRLTANAAQRSGAGYVKLFSRKADAAATGSIVNDHYVNGDDLAEKLSDPRISVVVLGPGLGRDQAAQAAVEVVLPLNKPVLLDADALVLLGEDFGERVGKRNEPTIATPHAGEFAHMQHTPTDSKIEATQNLAQLSNTVIVNKGSDTVVANETGQCKLSKSNWSWLSAAGTGDVLAGIIAARFAVEKNAYIASQQGQWLHCRAAQLAGASFSPEMLIDQIPSALSECL